MVKKNASALNDTQYGFNCYKRVEDLTIFTQIPDELHVSHGSFCTKKNYWVRSVRSSEHNHNYVCPLKLLTPAYYA